MGALKFSHDKEVDNIDTIPELKETIQDWLEEIGLPFESERIIEAFEYKSRDGFSAHYWNKGGLDLLQIENFRYILGSGSYHRLSIADRITKIDQDTVDMIAKDYPNVEENSDEWYELHDEYLSSEYDECAYRIRVMYEGEGLLKIYSGYDFDAPYYRWRSSTENEWTIKFKTIKGLKGQLKRLTKKVENKQ